MIIQGPQATARSLSGELLGHLQQLARAAGRTLEMCSCGGLRDFVARVRAGRSQTVEFMLLDPGDLAQQVQAHPEAGLGDALDELSTPYIEVHDDSDGALEPRDCLHSAPLATIIFNGDLAVSYQIALGIALKQLGSTP
jgi:3-dehydroquinate dehydratase-2